MRLISWSLGLGLILTLLSGYVPRRTTMVYTDIDDCVRGCEVAAAGIPVVFIADYPGLSPAMSADTDGVMLGVDKMLWAPAILAFLFWTLVAAGLLSCYTYVRTGLKRGRT